MNWKSFATVLVTVTFGDFVSIKVFHYSGGTNSTTVNWRDFILVVRSLSQRNIWNERKKHKFFPNLNNLSKSGNFDQNFRFCFNFVDQGQPGQGLSKKTIGQMTAGKTIQNSV